MEVKSFYPILKNVNSIFGTKKNELYETEFFSPTVQNHAGLRVKMADLINQKNPENNLI